MTSNPQSPPLEPKPHLSEMQIEDPTSSSKKTSFLQTMLSSAQLTHFPTTCRSTHHELDISDEIITGVNR